jgi:hypothetical protein
MAAPRSTANASANFTPAVLIVELEAAVSTEWLAWALQHGTRALKSRFSVGGEGALSVHLHDEFDGFAKTYARRKESPADLQVLPP